MWRKVPVAVAVLVSLLAVAASVGAAPGSAQADGLTATFATSSEWGSGFVGSYTIQKGGTSTVNGWRLEFDLPASETVTSAWNGVLASSSGHYVLTDEAWTRAIAPGASVQVGFQVASTAGLTAPQNCLLDGAACSGSAPPPPDTTPPTAPSGLTAGTPAATSIPLSWNASTDDVAVSGYLIYSGSVQVTTTTATAATVSGLTPATTYTFTVKASDAAGNLSAPSNAVTSTTAAPPSGALTATFAKTSDWGTGFVGNYTIRNGGTSTVNGWRLEFDLPAETITSAWNGVLSSTATHYVLTPASWTSSIGPRASVQVGFQGTYSGGFTAPQNCLLNGGACSGSAPPPDTTPPTVPTGLTATAPTATTVSLSWNASTDDIAVSGYEIYVGSTQLLTVTTTSALVTGLTASTSYTFTVRAFDPAGNRSAPSNPVTATTSAAPGGGGGPGATPAEFAPYVDMTLYPQFALGNAVRTAGIRHFTLAFLVSGGSCSPAWGGVTPLDDPGVSRTLSDLRSAGGDAIVSFGGAAGQDLASACGSSDLLAAQYQAVIDRYGIRDLDFDVEGAAVADAASIARRSQALAKVQAAGRAAGKPVHVSLTLPVLPTGLTPDGLGVIRSAIANGVDVGQVNVMAMDYYDPSLNYPGHMGDLAVQAAQATKAQLAALYPGLSDARLWAMVGVTPMIGINDDPKEVFTTADAATLTTFAQSQGLGRLALWSANRDTPCPAPSQWASPTCSGVSDPQWRFSETFKAFGA